MVLTHSPFTPFTGNIGELTRVTPFTHRDNATFLSILTGIVNYLKEGGTLHTEVQAELQRIIDEFNAGLDLWDTRYVALMLALQDQITVLNEAAFPPRVPATTVYVNPVTGLDTNNGTVGAPYRTINKAMERAEYGAQNTDTEYIIELAAGSYTERVVAAKFTPYALNVTIQGPVVPHPASPIVVFTEGTNVSAAAIKTENPNLDLTVKYVKFVGYNGTSSSAGINSAHGRLTTLNVHAESCFFGLSSIHGELTVPDGVFTNCGRLNDGTGTGAAIRSLMLNQHTIGVAGAGTAANGPLFTGNRYGFFAQESSTGHVNWCRFEDNESGLVLKVNSRANGEGNSYKRNSTDVIVETNSHVYVPDTVVFGTGADKSDQTVTAWSGGRVGTTKAISDTSMDRTRPEDATYGDYELQTVTGTTSSQAVFTRTLLAPYWNDELRFSGAPPKRLKLRAAGTITGTAGTKQIIFQMGGKTSSATFIATQEGVFTFEGTVLFAEPTRQIVTSEYKMHLADTRMSVDNTAQDMSVNQDLVLRVILGNAADAVSFEYVELLAG